MEQVRHRTDDAVLLSTPRTIGELDRELRQELTDSGSHANIMVGETNSSAVYFGKQTVGIVNAMFLVDDMLTWLEQGVAGIDWYAWQIAMAADDNHPQLYGDANFGTIGLLSTGDCVDMPDHRRICEPPRNTPFAPYFTLKLVSQLTRRGTRLVQVRSDNATVVVHALSQPDGRITVVLINTDRTRSHRVHVDLPGISAGKVTLVSFADKDDDLQTGEANSVTDIDLGPYSVTALTGRRPD